jgi:hypothetical protein
MADTDYSVRGSGIMCSVADLSAAVSYFTTVFPLVGWNRTGPNDVAVGMAALIDEEIVRVVNIGSGNVTVARGCLDTVPAPHALGAEVWFFGTAFGSDRREYAATETLGVKLLPKTVTGGSVPISGSPPNTITFNWRFARPYPPGLMQANGVSWFSATQTIDNTHPAVALTWTHRDRITQSDQLIEHGAASVGPEAGVTYTVRVYSTANVLLATRTGIVGTSWAYTLTMAKADFSLTTGQVDGYLRFSSQRDGHLSWQDYRIDIHVDARNYVDNLVGTASAVGRVATIS